MSGYLFKHLRENATDEDLSVLQVEKACNILEDINLIGELFENTNNENIENRLEFVTAEIDKVIIKLVAIKDIENQRFDLELEEYTEETKDAFITWNTTVNETLDTASLLLDRYKDLLNEVCNEL